MLIAKTVVEAVCDGPDCPISYKWCDEEIAQDQSKMPDPVWKFMTLAGFKSGKWTFCSKYCLLEFMKGYTAPKSPSQELAEVEKKKKEIEEVEKLAGGNKVLEFPNPTEK